MSQLNNFCNVKTVNRDQLFYNTYKYCLRLNRISRAHIMQDCFTTGINALSRAKKLGLIYSRLMYYKKNLNRDVLVDDPKECQLGYALVDLLDGNSNYFASIDYGRISFYSNDQNTLAAIVKTYLSVGYENDTTLIIAKAVGQPGVKTLKHSKFQYRTYLNETARPEDVNNIFNWLRNQGDAIKCSPALKFRIHHKGNSIRRYFYFDHNDMKLLSFLNIVRLKAYRKTLSIKTTLSSD